MTQKETIEYEITTFALKADIIGPNKATLLHARTTKNDSQFYKAILYIHGYSDYYFHDHICQRFLDRGYDFYALDLRKCGRSIISPHHEQYKHYCTNLREYDEEITLAIEHIIKEARDTRRKILLFGHSTGGLIATLYAHSGSRHSDIDGIILNSPYLSSGEFTSTELLLLNLLAKLRRSEYIDAGWYGKTIHVSEKGEWDFDLNKKPIDRVRLHGAFFAAVSIIQHDIMKGLITVKCPTLCLCSSRSMHADKSWRDEYEEVDLLLNVRDMRRAASMIGSQVTICLIEKAKHDIFLSKESVRENAFNTMFQWLRHLENDWCDA